MKVLKVLITAGATQTPIDQVRAITNIFRGTTGHLIANQMRDAGHEVTLLTSNQGTGPGATVWIGEGKNFQIFSFKTYDDLAREMAARIPGGGFDLVIHSAAVSDYTCRQVFVPSPLDQAPLFGDGRVVVEPIAYEGKTSSKHTRLFLELVPTEKLVDKIRGEWGFKGTLVKFKLEVGKTDHELIVIASASCEHSDADMIVANCLEWAKNRAYVIDREGFAQSVRRDEIARAILARMP